MAPSRALAWSWSSAEVRRWLENEGFCEFWPYVEPCAPFTGQDLLSLTSEDWHRLFQEQALARKPSVIKVRRLMVALAKLKNPSVLNGVPPGMVTELGDGPGRLLNETVFSDKSSDEDDDDDDRQLSKNKTKGCPNCVNGSTKRLPSVIKPERWKALLAFTYVLVVSWITAFVMVIVHDRVPDMDTYPPLPDIILDNIPHIPWAFEMCEITGMVLLSVWFIVAIFHKHRFILLRRFFSISGTIFLLRCITMLITSLSVPGKHLDCQPRPYGDIWNKLHNAFIIWTGAGMTLQGVRTCGDYMFSGHTVSLTLLNFFITEYTTRRIYFLHTFTWICNVFGVFFILASHEHYSIDVFVAFYISSRLFMYYHMLANQRKTNKSEDAAGKKMTSRSFDAQRTWFWFPLFSFFESGIDGKIPNEFEWPLTVQDVRDVGSRVESFFSSLRSPSSPTKGDPGSMDSTFNESLTTKKTPATRKKIKKK